MRGPKIQDGDAVVRMHHLAEKHFNTVEAPNHIYSRTKFQLSNLITSGLFWTITDRVPTLLVTRISRNFPGISRAQKNFSRTMSYASDVQI